jgi:hypothetical protein
MYGDRLLQVHPDVRFRIGIEAYAPYLMHSQCRGAACPDRTMILADMREFDKYIPAVHRDVAVFVDSLEHLPRAEAFALMARVLATFRKVLLFVPEGDHPQTTDGTGQGGDFYQTHRSTWRDPDVHELGFSDVTVDSLYFADDPDHPKSKGCGAIFAVWEKP